MGQYRYDRVAAQKEFNARSEEAKGEYLSGFSVAERKDYQGNPTPEELEKKLNMVASSPAQRGKYGGARGGRKVGLGRR